jgi:hypothetical protein
VFSYGSDLSLIDVKYIKFNLFEKRSAIPDPKLIL